MFRSFTTGVCLALLLCASSLHADVITTVGGPNVFNQGQSNALVSIFVRGNVAGQELGLSTVRFEVLDSTNALVTNAILPIVNNGEAYFGNGVGNPLSRQYFGREFIDLGGNSRLVTNSTAPTGANSRVEFTYAFNQGPNFSLIPQSDALFVDIPINSNLPAGTYSFNGSAIDIDGGTGGYFASNGLTAYPTQFTNGSFTIQAVPEPNSMLLLLAGSVFVVRRRASRPNV
jgi:hypothetical protein